MDKKGVLAKCEEKLTPVIEELGFEVVEIELGFEYGGWMLRIFIDRKDGAAVAIADCTKVSREASAILDVEDIIDKRYNLEVSSPGLNRPLRKAHDFVRFAGKNIKLKTIEPINGRGNFHGELLGMVENDILMKVDGVEYKVPLNNVQKARIDFKF